MVPTTSQKFVGSPDRRLTPKRPVGLEYTGRFRPSGRLAAHRSPVAGKLVLGAPADPMVPTSLPNLGVTPEGSGSYAAIKNSA
jgi:hypothetical protein